jgi:hypothetical protein
MVLTNFINIYILFFFLSRIFSFIPNINFTFAAGYLPHPPGRSRSTIKELNSETTIHFAFC